MRRPRERGDPYAAAPRFGTVANGFSSNKLRWLWVPAFAGTTTTWSSPVLLLVRLLAANRLQLGEHRVDVEIVALFLGGLELRFLAGGLGSRQQGGAAVGGIGG